MKYSVPPASSLTQSAYERLRADLLACRLLPGTRLKTVELSERLSVNLSAIREALARLTSEGFVVAEPQRGYRVADVSAAELRDLTQVRTNIEGLCLENAINSGDLAWEVELVAALHRLSGTPTREQSDSSRLSDAWSLAHAAFHEAMVAGCTSPWLLRLRTLLYMQTERYRQLSIPVAAVERDLRREHEDLANAALARNVPAAKALMAEHLQRTTDILLAQTWLT